jgi:signal transduction histidine kinase
LSWRTPTSSGSGCSSSSASGSPPSATRRACSKSSATPPARSSGPPTPGSASSTATSAPPRATAAGGGGGGGAGAGGRAQARAADEGLLGRLAAGGEPLRLSDAAATLEPEDLPSSRRSARSFLGTPVFQSGALAGWFYLTDKLAADEFNEADERLAATLATQVAVFYEKARLYAEAQRSAVALRQEVAERKAAEEERARMLIREQAARAEAEQANRTKDEFLATLSHELRTPLTAILGWSHLLRSGKFSEEHLGRALETIERNARSQSQLIDDLLDVSRIITGKLSLDVRPVELATIVEAAIDSMRPAADAKNIRFEVAVADGGCQVTGDANRLQQVVWNLFSNAVKFTPEGGRVEVRLARAGTNAQITIRDTGAGIEPHFLPIIFDRFRQADGSTTRKHGGLGLGLSIVRHLVELHGGTISVHSDGADQGSTFTVSLPLRETAAKPAAVAAAAEPYFGEGGLRAPRQPPSLDGLRILLVDDEADTRDMLSTILAKCGAVVRGCGSADEAMTLVSEWRPDLLVSDIGMPHEDGYSLIRRLRPRRARAAETAYPAAALSRFPRAFFPPAPRFPCR